MAVDFQERLSRCAGIMRREGFDALLLAKPANMFYLTGDGRLCAFALVDHDGRVFLGVPRTDVQDVRHTAVADEIAGFDDEVGMIHGIAHAFERFGISVGAVGVEYTFLTRSMMSMLTHPHAKPPAVEVRDCTKVMSELRAKKDAEEIARIRAAAEIGVAGMAAAVGAVAPGVTESQIAAEAEHAMRLEGADEFWRTYVSSGPRTNIAHGIPTQRRIEEGDLVMIDLHPIANGYSADLCRTVAAGAPSAEQQEAYDLFLVAQQAAIAGVRAGGRLDDLESALHKTLSDAGHADHIFGPPMHGVGIEFEEAPLPPGHAFFHGEPPPPPLEAGVVLAVGNCGLYTGAWGIRVEDTVVAGATGPEVLTGFPRSLMIG